MHWRNRGYWVQDLACANFVVFIKKSYWKYVFVRNPNSCIDISKKQTMVDLPFRLLVIFASLAQFALVFACTYMWKVGNYGILLDYGEATSELNKSLFTSITEPVDRVGALGASCWSNIIFPVNKVRNYFSLSSRLRRSRGRHDNQIFFTHVPSREIGVARRPNNLRLL